MRKSDTVPAGSGGKRFAKRTGLGGLIAALMMAFVVLVNPTAAAAASCDGTYVIAGQTASNGNPMFQTIHTLNYPNPSGEFTMPTFGDLRYVAMGGVIRPNGFAVYSFFRDLPGGPVLVAQFRKTASGNGVILQEPGTQDSNVFANPGDRLRVQGFWETNAFCTPGRFLDSTLGWINFI